MHHIIHVSRFVSLFPLDDQTHVQCKGYIESEIDTAADAVDLAKICLSMREAHKP